MAELLGVATGIIGLLPAAAQVVDGFRKTHKAIAQMKACASELRIIEVDLQVQDVPFPLTSAS